MLTSLRYDPKQVYFACVCVRVSVRCTLVQLAAGLDRAVENVTPLPVTDDVITRTPSPLLLYGNVRPFIHGLLLIIISLSRYLSLSLSSVPLDEYNLNTRPSWAILKRFSFYSESGVFV